MAGKYYFKRQSERDDISKLIARIPEESYDAIFLLPLREKLPITAPYGDRGKKFTQLNRHAVLHGESSDYGTRKNSLMALSFLNYIAVVFGDAVATETDVAADRKSK